MKPQIANIINFIRGTEPRQPMDLLHPVEEQLKLMKTHGLTGTFLMQYDALINPDFVSLLSKYSHDIEIGGWLEIVKPMCDAAGIPWRGRPGYSWDWHANVGFSVGYTKQERVALADVFMKKFNEIWGYYPSSVGSWIIDAHTLAHLSDRYGILASCNCKDQWGTDGYTLWGGYYSQAYYPSKNNALCPAQSLESQIPVPVFRMLGSDPIYQYDAGLDLVKGSTEWQQVITLEPVYSGSNGGGGNPSWVDWFLRENYNGICLSFAYAQIGQENSFGWDSMMEGFTYQIKRLAALSREGIISVQTLSQSGRWYKKSYALTPASALAALTDWKNEGYQSIWYNCRNYRINILCQRDRFRIRDIYMFDERYAERYDEKVCKEPLLIYDNLPVMDGNRWSGHGILAGIYPLDPDGQEVTFINMDVKEHGENLILTWLLQSGDKIICNCKPDMLEWQFPFAGYGFRALADAAAVSASLNIDSEYLHFNYRGFDYSIHIPNANLELEIMENKAEFHIIAREKEMRIRFL